ncbi:L-ornithine N(5)-monooxygenase [Hyphodiscus hymeniophilus]|uniref:L-ornithine N(5)-monooxygenase [NAD(P)H] n=1 Tax=Hyphodiscus hymeniophilus TaxID=353542 RepID=A0A9P6VET1_9HELO|nr:L-ornithine N(5)-monooxygenase [Hyphodiscus hymeniophilus]
MNEELIVYRREIQTESTPLDHPTDGQDVQDLICIGFGPASLAIAIALQERNGSLLGPKPKVSFLERQSQFAWHSGMQLPGAKMQISFLKDLATPRNPQSPFTFLNYLYQQNRLNQFINLGTFLPTRLEYEDYLRWCAGHFEALGMVSYGQEVVKVFPDVTGPNGKVSQFRIVSKDSKSGKMTTRTARHVVIAVGGKPVLPKEFPQDHPKVIHSSRYSTKIDSALADKSRPYHLAVVGSGQSAAEIFNDLPTRYPNAKVTMIIKGASLRPSDDSPFVNEIFDPDRVDGIYSQAEELRALAIAKDRATNYSVVRLDLLEHLYQRLYMQRLQTPDVEDLKVQIKANRQVIQSDVLDGGRLRLKLQNLLEDGRQGTLAEELAVDAVFVATGYVRNAHEGMMSETQHLLKNFPDCCQDRLRFPVTRAYKVDFDEKKVADNAGIWLQGCNEKTHGRYFALDLGD